ncbi:hypothetical protein H6G33_10695 [Calothrix sp. FACHB-1219]|uniref:hypothetical protein n=1 Tax=unclassified Calothrix TaxID=2619626 RepID=UPI0016859F93|nr:MULTISPECIES: hypothetical protein [unclassified Calothrix]MBD2201816.1 hypothetical protein [Calothrix sp. FACHB-168]MBD2217502.1 hypothetical protein [Calothrix sp. FACHB-1219]
MTYDIATELQLNIDDLASRGINNFIPIELDNLTPYLRIVRKQNLKYLEYPKRDRFTFVEPVKLFLGEKAIEIILNEDYRYVGIVPLEGQLNYEFYKSITGKNTITDSKFLYVPVNIGTTTKLSSKLPKVYSWDVNTNSININYPDKFYIYNSRIEEWNTNLVVISDRYTHNFLPGFYFTGRLVTRKELILYEYQDLLGLYGPYTKLYTSPLPPMQLDFPLGFPLEGEIEIEECILDSIGYYPASGYLHQIGTFTGYKTNNNYFPYLTFYMYERSNGTAFLSPIKPHEYGLSLIQQLIPYAKLLDPSITLIGYRGVQTYTINTSTSSTEETIHIS